MYLLKLAKCSNDVVTNSLHQSHCLPDNTSLFPLEHASYADGQGGHLTISLDAWTAVAMSASLNSVFWNMPMDLPNCCRVCTYRKVMSVQN